LFTWIGLRSLAGFSIIVLYIALLSRISMVNQIMGGYGCIYILSGLFSLLIQYKLPYMIPEGGLLVAFMRDFGRDLTFVGSQMKSDLESSASVIKEVAKI
jgi:hypothetical protein